MARPAPVRGLWSRSSPPRWTVLLGRAISGNASSRRPSARRGGLLSRAGSRRVSLSLDLEVALGCGMPLMGDSLATAGSAERSTLPVCHSSTQHFSLVFYILFGLRAVPTQYRQVREAGSDSNLACLGSHSQRHSLVCSCSSPEALSHYFFELFCLLQESVI